MSFAPRHTKLLAIMHLGESIYLPLGQRRWQLFVQAGDSDRDWLNSQSKFSVFHLTLNRAKKKKENEKMEGSLVKERYNKGDNSKKRQQQQQQHQQETVAITQQFQTSIPPLVGFWYVRSSACANCNLRYAFQLKISVDLYTTIQLKLISHRFRLMSIDF